MSRRQTLCVGLLVFAGSCVATASPPLELKYNPFAYTESQAKAPSRKAIKKAPAVFRVKWRRELNATIVAGGQSLANVEGRIISIGEKLDGFTLIRVGSQTATFEKGRNQVILKMTPKRK